MLLTLRTSNTLPSQESFSENDILAYGPRRYRKVQYMCDQFWHRWRSEYLHTLTARHKWKTRIPCISQGDVVLIRDKNLLRNDWPMGRVSSTKPSKDGLVRSVNLTIAPLPGKSQTRTLNRSINDLVLLVPSESHQCFHPALQTQDPVGVSKP